MLILVPTETFWSRKSSAQVESISEGGVSCGTWKERLWCVGVRTSLKAARFETGGRLSLTCYRRLCMSKPNAYGEKLTSESGTDSKSRGVKSCKSVEGTLELAYLCEQRVKSSPKFSKWVERVEGKYHKERSLGNKSALAKGRKTFKGKCGLQHTFEAAGAALHQPGLHFVQIAERSLLPKLEARAHSLAKFEPPQGPLSKCDARLEAKARMGRRGCLPWLGWGTRSRVGRSRPLRGAQRFAGSARQPASADPAGSGHERPLMQLRPSIIAACAERPGVFQKKIKPRGHEGREVSASGQLQWRKIGARCEPEVQREVNGSNIMTLSQPQLKGASVSSTRYGLTKLAELKRHRDGKYRHIIDILADPLVLLVAYGHLKVKYRTPGLLQLGKPIGSDFDLSDDTLRVPLESIERECFDFMAKRLREGNYECKPARRVVIPKPPNPSRKLTIPSASRKREAPSDKRPISIVSPRDQIVQEVVLIILSYIYGGSLYKGFRQSRGCHRALKDIRRRWNGVSWFIEFDIRPRNEKISRRILVNILREDIQDQRFFNLLHKMFKTNLVNLFPSNKAPQGLSRLLCDIYLSKLDKEVQRIQVEYNSSHRTCRENPVFTHFTRVTLGEKIQLEFNRYKIRRLLHKRIRRAYKKGISKTYYNNPNDLRIFYVRYIDHFLFGVIGSKLLVQKVQNRVSQFLKSGLHFEVSKTTITHSTAGMVNFLGMNVQCTLPPKYCALRRSSESLKRIRLRLKTQSLLRKKAWEASIRRIAFHKWAEAFEKTRKLLGSTTLAKRVAFSNAFELAQRLTTNNLLGPQIGGSTVSQLLTAEKALFSSIIWKGLPQEIKRKHVEFISLLEGLRSTPCGYNRLNMSTLSGTRSGCTGSRYSTKSLPPRILAPLDHIRDQLRRRGIVEDKNFRPTASKRMLNHEDSIIVNYFRAIAQGLLSYYRCCDNFHKVKRIATYHIRWAALHTLANKHKLTVKNAIYCYTLNLVIRQEFNGQVIIVAKFPSKKDIAIMRKKFLVDADLPRYSGPFAGSASELRRKSSDKSIYAS